MPYKFTCIKHHAKTAIACNVSASVFSAVFQSMPHLQQVILMTNEDSTTGKPPGTVADGFHVLLSACFCVNVLILWLCVYQHMGENVSGKERKSLRGYTLFYFLFSENRHPFPKFLM